jgi:hypothetical protein
MFGSTRRPILATLVLGLALPFAAILSPTTTPTATAAVEPCYTAQSGGAGDDYDGPSASYRYDRIFSRSFGLQHRFTHTQQGIATWRNWRGGKADIFLVTSYAGGADSYVTAYRASNGSYLNTIRIAAGHVGGIAVGGGWAFISGKFAANGSHTIRKYRLSDFRRALLSDGPYEYVTQVGSARHVYGASFLSAAGGYLYAGRHDTNSTNWMYRYKINRNGSLTTGARYQVPKKTQGLVVTGTHFIYSTSWKRENRSNIWVVRRGQELLADSRFSCFRAPSMSQGLTVYGKRVYLNYESGSVPYVRDEDTLNKIGYVHRAPNGQLTGLA